MRLLSVRWRRKDGAWVVRGAVDHVCCPGHIRHNALLCAQERAQYIATTQGEAVRVNVYGRDGRRRRSFDVQPGDAA